MPGIFGATVQITSLISEVAWREGAREGASEGARERGSEGGKGQGGSSPRGEEIETPWYAGGKTGQKRARQNGSKTTLQQARIEIVAKWSKRIKLDLTTGQNERGRGGRPKTPGAV